MAKEIGMSAMRATTTTIVCALLLAACGGSSTQQTSAAVPVTTPAGTTTSATSTSTASTTTASTTTASTTTASTTTGSAAAPPACLTADFALRFLDQDGATGHGEVGFALRNTSAHECHTYGYPGILFLDKAGNALPTNPTHTTIDFFGTTTETELAVLPGASVSFRLGVSHGAASPIGCTTAYGLQVIAPDDTATTRTTIPQGIYECGGGATVSPLQPAETAFSQ
jgi:hypothetical protein